MSGKTGINQGLVRGSQGRFVQFNGSADKDLTLFSAQHRQFFQDFRETHNQI